MTPFRIEEHECFRVVGYAIQTTNQKKEGSKRVPAHWAEFHERDLQASLLPMMNQEPYGVFGISMYNIDETDSRKFDYVIGVSSDLEAAPGMRAYEIPAATWAIFPCTIDTIGKTEVQAITKWLPRSDYRPLNSGYLTGRMKSAAPDIEYHGKDGETEVWVAVRKK